MEVVRLEHFGRRTGLARRELGESGNDGQSTEYFDGAALIVRWTAWLLADALVDSSSTKMNPKSPSNEMTQPAATFAPTAFGVQVAPRNSDLETANLETARRFLAAIEASTDTSSTTTGGADTFYAPDVVQEEFPNRFVPAGARRDLDGLRAAAERGKAVLSGQRFHVRAAYAVGETVILEVLWVGVLTIAVGTLAAGEEMRAHFAVFLEFRDGKIVRQRNYDCFEPF